MITKAIARVGPASMRALWAICGAGVGATVCWIAWGITTPGDYFGNGSLWVGPSIAGSAAATAYFVFRARSKRNHRVLAVLALMCAVFWIAVPDGWWAKPPPWPTRAAVLPPVPAPSVTER